VATAWNQIKEETEAKAKFHSELADGFSQQIASPMKELVRATEKQIKKQRTTAKSLLSELSRVEKSTEDAKTKYEKARKKQFDAKDEYERASFSANTNPKLKDQLSKRVQSEHKVADKLDTQYAEQVSRLQVIYFFSFFFFFFFVFYIHFVNL
jgi:Fe2+ transport system protein B